MKVVIIGGGIAGLTLGTFLHKKNFEIVVNEKSVGMPSYGHAFLMHAEGLMILNELNSGSPGKLPGKLVNTFSLRRPDNTEIKHLQLDSWKCIKRIDLISFLYTLLPRELIKEGRSFSHFKYESGKAVAAVFENGEVEYGDVFIGADGKNSLVREKVLGKVKYSPILVKEVVGICNNPEIAQKYLGIFTKFQDKNCGLAFGLIPTSENELVWFLQYDSNKSDIQQNKPEGIRDFCFSILENFPPLVRQILESNNFATTYVWNTTDFDLLRTFHLQNVVLIGDAAHVAVPFTSAGTTNAIVDAKVLAQNLTYESCYQHAFQKYYEIRFREVAQHIELGRKLGEIFLNPQNQSDDDIPVPLIAQKENTELLARNKKIQVLYFTDPVCSTCWIIQPLLRKLQLEYGDYIHIKYCMGGLLPSWDNYHKGKISKPSEAAKHWEEVCAFHEMPLDGDVWKEDPLHSSYPPSIAFKAAQMQDTDTAILFLRRIKEMVFLEKKNIIKWEFLEKAAFEVGLDSARLLRDFNGKARLLFEEDLLLAQKLGVTGFPTLFFSDKHNNKYEIKGYQDYEKFEEIIYNLVPDAVKRKIDTDPEVLFSNFKSMTEKEFAFLSNISRPEASKILQDLYNEGNLGFYESKNGRIWISKFETNLKLV